MSETLLDLNVGMNADFSGLSKSMDSAASLTEAGMNRMYQSAMRFMGVAGVSGAMWKAAESFQNFSQVVADISSITSNNIEDIEKKLLKLNNVLGAPDKLGDIFYETISSGIRGANQELTNFVETSAKTATVIRADAFTTSSALTTMMNAYGKSAKDASELLDFFYVTVREGKAHGDELARTMGLAVNNAAESGVAINEFGAAIATLSRTMTTSNALISINQMMNSFLGPTAEATAEAKKYGIELSMEAVRAKGFAGVLKEMHERVGGNTAAIRRMFGELRAARGAFALTGNQFEAFMEILNQMELKAGTGEEAFKKQAATAKMAYNSMLNQSNKAAIQIGRDNEGITRTIYGVVEATGKAFTDTTPLTRYTLYIIAMVKAFQALKAEIVALSKIHNNMINPSAPSISGGTVTGNATSGKLANINGEQISKTSAEFGAAVDNLVLILKRAVAQITQTCTRAEVLSKEAMHLKLAFDEMVMALKNITRDFGQAVRSVEQFAKLSSDFAMKVEILKTTLQQSSSELSKATASIEGIVALARHLMQASASLKASFSSIDKASAKAAGNLTTTSTIAENVAVQIRQIGSGYLALQKINTRIIASLNSVVAKFETATSVNATNTKNKDIAKTITPAVVRQEQAARTLVTEMEKQTTVQSNITAQATRNMQNTALVAASTAKAAADLGGITAKGLVDSIMRGSAYSDYDGSSAQQIDRKASASKRAPKYTYPTSKSNSGVNDYLNRIIARTAANELEAAGQAMAYPKPSSVPGTPNYSGAMTAGAGYLNQRDMMENASSSLRQKLADTTRQNKMDSVGDALKGSREASTYMAARTEAVIKNTNEAFKRMSNTLERNSTMFSKMGEPLAKMGKAVGTWTAAALTSSKELMLIGKTGSFSFANLGMNVKAGLDSAISKIGNAGMTIFGGLAAADMGWEIGKAIAEKFEFDKSDWMEAIRGMFDGGNAKMAEIDVQADLLKSTRAYAFSILKRKETHEKFTEAELRQFAIQLTDAKTQEQVINVRKRILEQLEKRLDDGDKRKQDEKMSEEALNKARQAYADFLKKEAEGKLPAMLNVNQLSKVSGTLGALSGEANKLKATGTTSMTSGLSNIELEKMPTSLPKNIRAILQQRLEKQAQATSGLSLSNPKLGIRRNLGSELASAVDFVNEMAQGKKTWDDVDKLDEAKRKTVEAVIAYVESLLSEADKALDPKMITSEKQRLLEDIKNASKSDAMVKANNRMAELDKAAASQTTESDVRQARVFMEKSGKSFEFDKDVTLGAKLKDTADTYNAYMEQLKGQFEVLDNLETELKMLGYSQEVIDANTSYTKGKIAETKKHINEAQNVIVDTTAKIVDEMVKGFNKDFEKSVTGLDTEAMTTESYTKLQQALTDNYEAMIAERAKQAEKLKGATRQEDIKEAQESIDALNKAINKRVGDYTKAIQNRASLKVSAASSQSELNRLDYEMGSISTSDFNKKQIDILRDVVTAEKEKLASMKEGTAEYYNQLVAVKRAEAGLNAFAKAADETNKVQGSLLKGMADFASGKDAKDSKGNLTNDALYHTVNLMTRALGTNPFGASGFNGTQTGGAGFPSMKNTQEAQTAVARTLDAYMASQKYAEANTGRTVQSIYEYLKSSGSIIVK